MAENVVIDKGSNQTLAQCQVAANTATNKAAAAVAAAANLQVTGASAATAVAAANTATDKAAITIAKAAESAASATTAANSATAVNARIDTLVAAANTSYYEKSSSGITGALLVVASGATTGQINLADVTPVATYTPIAGDYVRLVYGVASGNAELIDGRTDGNGNIHSTIGGNIRSLGRSINQRISFGSANYLSNSASVATCVITTYDDMEVVKAVATHTAVPEYSYVCLQLNKTIEQLLASPEKFALYIKGDFEIANVLLGSAINWNPESYVWAKDLTINKELPTEVILDFTDSNVISFFSNIGTGAVYVLIAYYGHGTSACGIGTFSFTTWLTHINTDGINRSLIELSRIAYRSIVADISDDATNATNADCAKHAGLIYRASELAYKNGVGAALTFNDVNTANIQYSVGNATASVYVARFKLCETIADLIGNTIYIKTKNNNTDTNTDVPDTGYQIGFSNISYQDWNNDYSLINLKVCLDSYKLSGDILRSVLLDNGCLDTDPCYVSLSNHNAYYAQTAYSCNKSMQCYLLNSVGVAYANEATNALNAFNSSNAGLLNAASGLAKSIGNNAIITFKNMNTANIQYSVGNATGSTYYARFALCKLSDLKDATIYIKTKNNNTDTNTDVPDTGYQVGFSADNTHDWGLVKQFIAFNLCYNGYAVDGNIVRASLLDAGYADTDICYVQLSNNLAYYAQTAYSCNKSMQCVVTSPNSVVFATKLGKYSESDIDTIASESSVATYITCGGDSLTAQGGWTSILASALGKTEFNAGTGGETVRTIAARQGADVMLVNNITIPADTTAVTLATMADDSGIDTAFGYKATPLLQGGSSHVNPCKIGDVEGTLTWTGSTWTFTRSTAGDAVTITRPTALRTNYDMNYNSPYLMVIFMGQNGGYTDNDDLVNMHKLMIDHTNAKHTIILGMHTGTASLRADYEAVMKKAFGRYFISLRQYLATPIYDTDGTTIISCYGLDDAGLTATADDLAKIAVGQVPLQLLSDGTHYTTATKTVIGNYLVKTCKELNII